jgi:hypothetical protein
MERGTRAEPDKPTPHALRYRSLSMIQSQVGGKCRVDSGLEWFGRPIAASSPSTVCEVDPQPRGGADQLQPKAPCWATTNDLRGCPSRSILATSAIGAYGG